MKLVPSLCLVVLCGCYFPVRVSGVNKFAGKVGPAESAAPIRVGVSTKGMVTELLGEPWNRPEPNDPIWYYGNYERKSIVIIPWPFVHGGPIQGAYRGHYVFLRFAPDGVLRQYQLWMKPLDDDALERMEGALGRFTSETASP